MTQMIELNLSIGVQELYRLQMDRETPEEAELRMTR